MPGIVRIRETRETKAELTAEKGGRVIAWHNDREAGLISLAVPGDRAKLTPAEARALGQWLLDNAATMSMNGSVLFERATLGATTQAYRR